MGSLTVEQSKVRDSIGLIEVECRRDIPNPSRDVHRIAPEVTTVEESTVLVGRRTKKSHVCTAPLGASVALAAGGEALGDIALRCNSEDVRSRTELSAAVGTITAVS